MGGVPAVHERRQREHFDRERNQYPRAALVDPPLHTRVETDRILETLRRGGVDDGTVVDFGAGTGRLSIPLAGAGYRVVAVDVSAPSLRVLQRVAAELGVGRIETRSTLPPGSFDAVVGADVLHHVDLDERLPSLRRLLRPGGKAVFSEPGALNPAWYVYLAVRRDLRVETGIVACNVVTLRRRLERAGFRDVSITGVGLLPRPLFGWSERACRAHDAIGDWPLVRWFAYRYLVAATA